MVRWRRTARRSDDLIDRRGSPARRARLPIGTGGKIGIPAVLAILIAVFFGGNILGGGGGGDLGGILEQLNRVQEAPPPGQAPLPGAPDPDAELVDFMSFVLDDVQNTWEEVFAASNQTYPRAQLVLFTGSVDSACGGATSAIGPHYCPLDEKVYLDLDFFRDLEARFGAPGDFAQAYVLAHEIAHHVQNVVGVMERVQQEQRANPAQANELSVKLELQADCLSGVWAHTVYQRDILESGDLQEGLAAAAAVGDDRIQQQATGGINPETWTHGSSEQRVSWFRQGFDTGDPNACNTF